ncbi:hypothetical protein MNEG_15307, partial [Monoraphidium neglectum]
AQRRRHRRQRRRRGHPPPRLGHVGALPDCGHPRGLRGARRAAAAAAAAHARLALRRLVAAAPELLQARVRNARPLRRGARRVRAGGPFGADGAAARHFVGQRGRDAGGNGGQRGRGGGPESQGLRGSCGGGGGLRPVLCCGHQGV